MASDGTQANPGGSFSTAISADGRYPAFESGADNLATNDTNYVPDIFVHDRETGVTQRVSVSSTGGQADNISQDPDISAGDRYVTFTSWASDLVPGGDFYTPDNFVHDRDTGETTIISGLDQVTLYHSRVHSRDQAGNESVAEDFTFNTIDTVAIQRADCCFISGTLTVRATGTDPNAVLTVRNADIDEII